MRHPLFRHARTALGLALLSAGARATWSICVVDTQTGEVCIASATCLSGFDLERALPVVVVGRGVGAAQSAIDQSGVNRQTIWDGLHGGRSPEEILQRLLAQDPQANSRQYGIVDMEHAPVSWTGTGAGQARISLTGETGSLKWAVQGNLLAGQVVAQAAAIEMLRTEGDLGQRVMAGMLAARHWGGDGRCSCSNLLPTSCGAPPPNFTQSARVAFIILARLGDSDGSCSGSLGCATGSYYLDLQKITGPGSIDPVLFLRDMYADWRAGEIGRPDHLLSEVTPQDSTLPADGTSWTTVVVRLRDIDGNPIAHGGAQVQVAWAGAGPPLGDVGGVVDRGWGVYAFRLQARQTVGTGRWSITVDDGLGARLLHPDLEIQFVPPGP